MKPAIRTALAFILLLSASASYGDDWLLYQNDPNPFCNDPGNTAIQMAVSVDANCLLIVTNDDGTQILRTIINGALQAGQHSVVWDGRDDAGALLSAGDYPIVFTATDPDSGELLYEATVIAVIACEMNTDLETWGKIKSCFFE